VKHASIAVLLVVGVSFAQEKPAPDRGEEIARVSLPGMQCDGACPQTVKAALVDGPGVKEVTVDFAKKSATLRYDADRTSAVEAVARLARLKAYATSTLSSVEAVFDGDHAKASATSDVKKRRARLKLHLEPKSGHTFNTGRSSPDLEIAVASLPAGCKAREPLVKVKGGLKTPRTFDLDVDLDAKARGEVAVTLEVRLDDIQGEVVKSRVLSLTVPILVP
jgi:periplasmic mercuric ion binding protein